MRKCDRATLPTTTSITSFKSPHPPNTWSDTEAHTHTVSFRQTKQPLAKYLISDFHTALASVSTKQIVLLFHLRIQSVGNPRSFLVLINLPVVIRQPQVVHTSRYQQHQKERIGR